MKSFRSDRKAEAQGRAQRESREHCAAWTPYTEQEAKGEKLGKEAEKGGMEKLESAANVVIQITKSVQEDRE